MTRKADPQHKTGGTPATATHPAHGTATHPAHPAHGPGKKGTKPSIDPNLIANLGRSGFTGSLGGVQISLAGQAARVKDVLEQDPLGLNTLLLEMAGIAVEVLPGGALSPMQQGVYLRQSMPNLNTFLVCVDDAVQLLAPSAGLVTTDPAAMMALLDKKDQYEGFMLLGMEMINAGMDQREITGAFLVYLIDEVLTALNHFFADPKVPVEKKDQVLKDFGPALLELDDVLKAPQVRKNALANLRGDKALSAKEAQQVAADAEVALRVRQNLLLPREALFAAARRFQQTPPPDTRVLLDNGTAVDTAVKAHTGGPRIL